MLNGIKQFRQYVKKYNKALLVPNSICWLDNSASSKPDVLRGFIAYDFNKYRLFTQVAGYVTSTSDSSLVFNLNLD